MSLLLSRDDKLKTAGFHDNNSIIALIAEELGEHTMLSAVSHKKHQSRILNLSNSSIFSTENSTTKRMYDKLSLFKLGRSSNSVLPVVAPPEVEISTSPVSPFTNTASSKKYLTHEQEIAIVRSQRERDSQRARALVVEVVNSNRRAAADVVMEVHDIESGGAV
jgi:hypothetical protein